MPKESTRNSEDKKKLHPRNAHRSRYEFDKLIKVCPELGPFVFKNQYNIESVNFSDPAAVKILNKSLLNYFYGISNWDIPPNYLCPPVPGRADYIHYLADVLSESNEGIIPRGKSVKVLDIGVGANCIYPLIGHQEYGWSFVGSDIDPIAIKSAKLIVRSNGSLANTIECRQQESPFNIFNGIVKNNEFFDISMCNPPFHSSAADAAAGNERKRKNLGIQQSSNQALNFGGLHTELWCEGGEAAFVRTMIEESATIPMQFFWFTTLISKSSNLPAVYTALTKANAQQVKTIDMEQGQKKSRIVAWTFLNGEQQNEWRMKRWEK